MMYQPPFMRGPAPSPRPRRPGDELVPSARDFMPAQPGQPDATIMPVNPGPRLPPARDFMPGQPKAGGSPAQMLANKMANRKQRRIPGKFGM